MTAHTHTHPIAHVPSPPQYQRHARPTRATFPNPAPPESPQFPTTCTHATGRTGPMPWSATPQPHRFSEPGIPCAWWGSRGGHRTHLHRTRHVPGRRGPFSSTSSLDQHTAAQPVMRDHQAVPRLASTSPALLHVHGQGGAACADWAACQPCLGTQPAWGTTCFSTQTRKQKIRPAAEKKKATCPFLNPEKKNIGEGGWWKEKITPRADPHTTTHQRAHAPPTPSARSHSLAPRLHVQSCTTIACAYRVSRQSQKGQTSTPPTPHKTQFPSLFTRFATHTTKYATPHSRPMTAHNHPHPIAHVPSPPQYQRHARPTRATFPNPTPPESPQFPTTCTHATGRTGPMPWSATPQPHRFSEPGTLYTRWSSGGGHSTHLHSTRHVPGRRGPFSSTSSLDPPTAAEPAMRDHQAVSRPASPSQRCCMYMSRAGQRAWTGLPANHASERSLHAVFFPNSHGQQARHEQKSGPMITPCPTFPKCHSLPNTAPPRS
jgi:hypothetical protein